MYNLINSGFIVHQELAIPHRVWPIRLDVDREDSILGFEVKRTLNTRSLGQVAWYSRYLGKLLPGSRVLLAISCHEFSKVIFPEIRDFLGKVREEFGVGICGVRDPLGDAPNGIRFYFNEIKWFDICRDCSFNKGFSCYFEGRRFDIPLPRIEEFESRVRKFLDP